jgi:hypothetical protein
MKPVRRSQAISPFGPGAMVDFPGPVSLIHAGINAWPFERSNAEHREFMITDEPRLAHRLGVEFFVIPPDYRRPQRNSGQTVNLNLKLPFLRFPRWHVCPIPSCGKMHFGEYHDRDVPVCRGRTDEHSHPPRKTFQVRFVAACSKGHLTDFPWVEWVFEGKQGAWAPDGMERWLTLKSSGSASLMGMQVSAEQRGPSGKIDVVSKRSLAGAFGSSASEGDEASSATESPLSRVGVTCNGANPVLATGTELRPAPGCGEHLQVVLKNATNIYFPNVVSSIYIPEVEDSSLAPEILELLDDRDMKSEMRGAALGSDSGLVSTRFAKQLLTKYHPEAEISPEDLANAANAHLLPGILLDNRNAMATLEQFCKMNGGSLSEGDLQDVLDQLDWAVEPSRLLPEISRHLDSITGKKTGPKNTIQPTGETPEEMAEEDAYRREEYQVFTQDIQAGFPKKDLDIRSTPVQEYTELAACHFQRIALLHKLRETRAFDGFSRMYSTGLSRDERRALFAEGDVSWLPAIIVRGEGIFVEFSHERIASWEATHADGLNRRLKPLRQSLAALAVRRKQAPVPITPRYLLLHTFSHILITELVQECGYGSASLRERIYSGTGENPMSGVLIYTSAGDSEGTMGGLVRMGEPDRFGTIVVNAINRARWCSADPVCIESNGQGPGNCNLAACHSCALLPETSCEVQNRLLDRAMLVGTLENFDMGYFSKII